MKRPVQLLLTFLFSVYTQVIYAQCDSVQQLWQQLLKLESSKADMTVKEKIAEKLKTRFENCGYPKDSVYARILHKLAVWQYYGSNKFNDAIGHTEQAIKINSDGNSLGSPSFVINSYYNLGIYYSDQLLYRNAVHAFDEGIIWGKSTAAPADQLGRLYFAKAFVYDRLGNYHEAAEAASGVLDISTEPIQIAMALIQRAQAFIYLNSLNEAQSDLDKAAAHLRISEDVNNVWADLYNTKAFLAQKIQQPALQLRYLQRCIKYRLRTEDENKIAGDCMDLALYFAEQKDFHRSYTILKNVLNKSTSPEIQSMTLINISDVALSLNNPVQAAVYAHSGLRLHVGNFNDTALSALPDKVSVSNVENPLHVFKLLANKAEALQRLYRSAMAGVNQNNVLNAFKLADAAIDEMRLRQSGEQTRLYWREHTRAFYQRALDAAYDLQDAESIFYFMEKSRAVLLNDKLSELGSLAILPEAERNREQTLRLRMASLEVRKRNADPLTEEYKNIVAALTDVKVELNRFIKGLEQRYPIYYQYKYQSVTPGISAMKEYLAQTGGTYISYSEGDSLIYALAITADSVAWHKIRFDHFSDSARLFLRHCSDKRLLNTRYGAFAGLARELYSKLVQPFTISPGRVVVSLDQHLIPLEALLTGDSPTSFLLYKHNFDYTYSAGYLLRTTSSNPNSRVGFLGIAPETYSSYMSLTNLAGSVLSIQNIASNYPVATTKQYKEASRNFFLQYASDFTLLHLYAHARVPIEGGEPVLYMSDSAVAVSELSRWSNPSVRFAFLAACETGVGETLVGEGMNSLARSFAAVGIPSTVANLWKVDNNAMYKISERFYYHLRKGISRSEALQQAKIDFIQSGSKETALPYYWGAAVLWGDSTILPVGRSDPRWLLLADGILIIIAAGLLYQKLFDKKVYRFN